MPPLDLRPWGLHPLLEGNVRALDAEFPNLLTVLSGFRDLRRQCYAMASNASLNRNWLTVTYTRQDRPSYGLAQRLQHALNAQPEVTSIKDITELFLTELEAAPLGTLISWHTFRLLDTPASLAVDFAPIFLPHMTSLDPVCDRIRSFAATLPHYDAFLFKEGGLIRFHYQIYPATLRPVQQV